MDLDELIKKVTSGTWEDRIAAIRAVPAEFPGREHSAVYAEVGRRFYVDKLAPHFHIVPWPESYADRTAFFEAYEAARSGTDDFTNIEPSDIEATITNGPRSLLIFRLLMGYTQQELADISKAFETDALSKSAIGRLEAGGAVTARTAPAVAGVARLISAIVSGQGGYSVSDELRDKGFRAKTDKPDTVAGWATVSQFAKDGVPYSELLYQRFYGGAFRQLQDAGGSRKGDILEDATEALFRDNGVPYVRTVPGTQATAGRPFGITVQPAPDFIIHDTHTARALLECKSAGDGGTARDKAGRFASLRGESQRLGGIPVIAVLEGLGWRRVNDALGPVVRDCDGRVFTMGNLSELLEVEAIRTLVGTT